MGQDCHVFIRSQMRSWSLLITFRLRWCTSSSSIFLFVRKEASLNWNDHSMKATFQSNAFLQMNGCSSLNMKRKYSEIVWKPRMRLKFLRSQRTLFLFKERFPFRLPKWYLTVTTKAVNIFWKFLSALKRRWWKQSQGHSIASFSEEKSVLE